MAINIGPTVRRRREWARLTQQELVDHTRMDRSASYISAIETGRTSPTLQELERRRLAHVERISTKEEYHRRAQAAARGAPTSTKK